MTKIKIYYDEEGNTLNIWFDEPTKEYISEEIGNEIILNKDEEGNVIGFEKLNFLKSPDPKGKFKIPVEIEV